MMARIYASRNTFLVAGIAAAVAFLTLVWVGKVGERTRPAAAQNQERPASEKRAPLPPLRQAAIVRAQPASTVVFDHWTPPPTEIVRTVTPVTLYNARGKEVKQFPPGKRLRVSKRAGEQITIDYLGEQFTIPAASTEPSQ